MAMPTVQHLSWDGQTFTASPDPSQPGTWHISWDSGPNPGYGFSVSSSDSQWHPENLPAHLRDFLQEVDPATGHLPG